MNHCYAKTLFSIVLAVLLVGGCGIDPINVPDAERGETTAAGDYGDDAGAPDAAETGSTDGASTDSEPDAGNESSDSGTDGDMGTDAGEDLAPDEASPVQTRKIFHAGDRTLMVGVENAVEADLVTIRDAETQTSLTQSDVAVTGAFTAQLETSLPDTVLLEIPLEDGSVDSAELELCDGGVDVYAFDALITQAWADGSLTADRSGNLINLSTAANLLPRGLKVVVGNLDNDHGSAAPVAQDGSMEISISANAGDDLALFAVEGNCNGGGEPLIIEAP